MKLVLDTNVLISAFLWKGTTRQILERIIDGQDKLLTANEILAEFSSVLSRPKFGLTPGELSYFLSAVTEMSDMIGLSGTIKNACRDSADDKILECALLGEADRIITGDADLLVLRKYKKIKILTPAEYLRSCT